MPSLALAQDQISDHLDRLLNEHEAAAFLNYTVRALQNWRLRGGGPRFVKVSGRSIRYRRRDLNEWVEQKLRASTADLGPVSAGRGVMPIAVAPLTR
jgi:hypothetical protein